MRFSPDGRYLAGLDGAPSRPGIRLIDPATGHALARLDIEAPAGLPDFRFDTEGRRLAVVVDRHDEPGEIRWWDLADLGARPHRRPIGPGRTSSGSRPMAGSSRPPAIGRILLLDPWSGSVLREIAATLPDPPGLTEFSADGSFAATHVGRSILVWQTETGRGGSLRPPRRAAPIPAQPARRAAGGAG